MSKYHIKMKQRHYFIIWFICKTLRFCVEHVTWFVSIDHFSGLFGSVRCLFVTSKPNLETREALLCGNLTACGLLSRLCLFELAPICNDKPRAQVFFWRWIQKFTNREYKIENTIETGRHITIDWTLYGMLWYVIKCLSYEHELKKVDAFATVANEPENAITKITSLVCKRRVLVNISPIIG